MNILKRILEDKEVEIKSAKNKIPVSELKLSSYYARKCLSLIEAIKNKDTSIIAEIKKASPSKGIICENFDHIQIAGDYIRAGATAISVLTDKKYFQGNIEYIKDIRPLASLPILRKDFIIDSYQIDEAKAYGADAVLLIAEALDANQLSDLHTQAKELGMDCLVEIHSERELDKIDFTQIKLVGVNNRNLEDFSVDITTTLRIASQVPEGIVLVSESGISSIDDIVKLKKVGVKAFLIGETLMRSVNRERALKELLQEL